MKQILVLALFGLVLSGAWAQTYEYSFATSSGTYTPITGGILLGTETSDDQRFLDPAVPAGGITTTGPGFEIGFNFMFNGETFDRLAINNNGWISLGKSALTPSVNITSSSGYTPISNTNTIDPPELYNRIAALARDIQAQTGGSLRLETIGTAPNRVCVIQWENYKKYGSTGIGDSFSFQIRLNETSNSVVIVYGAFTSNANYSNMQVGLRGPDQADFFSRTSDTGWDNTTASTAFNQYVVLSDVYFPPNGLTFTFGFPVAYQPPNPANLVSPADAAILVSPSATLNWLSGGGLPNGYRLYLGTNNPPTNIVNNVDLGTVTSYNPDPDLSLNTIYYWKVVPYNGFGDATNCPVWSFTTHGDPTITTLPYAQNWDLVTAPALPFDWTSIIQSTVTTSVVVTYTSSPFSAPNCVRIYNGADAAANVLLVGPEIGPALNVNNIRVKFQGKGNSTYHMLVGVMSNPADPATFVQLQDLNVVANWNEYVVSLAGYTGTGRFIAFKHASTASGQTIYVDDVAFEQIAPNDLACTRLSGNSTPSVGNTTAFNATIYNWGTATQGNYTVKLFNGSNVELASVAGVSVAPDATVGVPLSWTPTAEGPIVLYAKVFLTGDVNPANDRSPDLNVLVMPAGTTVVSIGDGTTTTGTQGYPTPYGTYYKNFHQQYLYTAAEILASGGAPGLITSIGYNVQAVNTCSPMPNYTIRIKSTDQTALTTTFEVGDYTQVWFQNDFLPVEGWNTHAFTTPFIWDGTSNILVDIITTLIPGAYTQNASVFYTATTGTNTALRYQNDTIDASTGLTGTVSENRANIRISMEVDGLAALNGSVSSGSLPLEAVDITLEGTSFHTLTDALGYYSFPYLLPGDYTVTASKLGYTTQTLPVSLTADLTTTLNFNLTAGTVPVELSSFTAVQTATNYVQLAWVTQSETAMLGYRVYRNTSQDEAAAIQITEVLIPATNTSSSHSYGLTDAEVSIGQTYYYWLEGVEFSSSEFYGPVSVALDGNVPPIWPVLTALQSAYPNPFRASTSTSIGVALKESESGSLTIYDIRGQVVRTYSLRQGYNTVSWNGRDSRGSLCGSGVYFYRLSTPSLTQTRKLVLTK